MDEPVTQSGRKGIDWKWVGLTLVLFILFYFLPLYLANGPMNWLLSGGVLRLFVGAWSFAGVVIVAGVAGFLSPGVTVREPAIAGILLMIGWFLVFHLISARIHDGQTLLPMTISAILVGLLSLFGAWIGEKLQSGWKHHPQSGSEPPSTSR